MNDKTIKRYIIRKYVMARSLEEAVQKEPMHVVDECFVDEEWTKKDPDHESAVGFSVHSERDSFVLEGEPRPAAFPKAL